VCVCQYDYNNGRFKERADQGPPSPFSGELVAIGYQI